MEKIVDQNVAQNLILHLEVLRKSKEDNKDEEFFELMNKAKETFGDRDRQMAAFYHYYGLYMFNKIEKNNDILGGVAQKAVEDAQGGEESGEEEEEEEENEQNKDGQIKDNNQPEITTENQNNKQGGEEEKEEEGDDDEWQICYQNLEVALSVLLEWLDKHNNGEVVFSEAEVQKLENEICEVRINLGDFFLLKQDIAKAIEQYQQAKQLRSKVPGLDKDRMYAEINYLIGNAYLYENNRQEKSMAYILKAAEVLTAHLEFISGTPIQEKPTQKKPNVNRLEYLPNMTDTPQVKDLKEIILPLLDKLQDLQLEIMQRGQFQHIKQQDRQATQQQQSNPFGVSSISPQAPVISLGTFGSASGTTTNNNPIIRIKTVTPAPVTPTPVPTSAAPQTNSSSKKLTLQGQTQSESATKRLNENQTPNQQ